MSEHTLLVNQVIGLCMSGPPGGRPPILRDLGFDVVAIEPTIANGDAVTPDLVLASKLHGVVLVVECKSGANVKREQDDRYAALGLDRIVRSLDLDGAWDAHVVAYAINEEHEGRIGSHTRLSLIVLGRDSVRGVGDFGAAAITRTLNAGVRLDPHATVDMTRYPFSLDDSHGYVDAHIAEDLRAYRDAHPEMSTANLANYDVADELLRQTHGMYDQLAPKYRRKLVDVVVASIKRIQGGGSVGLAGAHT